MIVNSADVETIVTGEERWKFVSFDINRTTGEGLLTIALRGDGREASLLDGACKGRACTEQSDSCRGTHDAVDTSKLGWKLSEGPKKGFVDDVVKSRNPKRVRKLKMPQVTITKMVVKARVRTTRERVTVVLYREGAGG